jgi:hypothetical protein
VKGIEMNTTPKTVDELLDYWPGNIPFKGKLISDDGCMCAQGQVLHLIGGMSPDDLRRIQQVEADRKTSELMGISRAHAVLLRRVNDSQPGAPTCVIREPEKVLGGEARRVLAFWRHLDVMTAADWRAIVRARAAAGDAARAAAGDAARDAAGDAARNAAGDAARAAAGDAAWNAAGDAARAAAGASNEIQGAAIMRERGQPFYFLPMFGFATPEEIPL